MENERGKDAAGVTAGKPEIAAGAALMAPPIEGESPTRGTTVSTATAA